MVGGDIVFDNLEPVTRDWGSPELSHHSPASSIMRYLNSPELEADRGDIVLAMQRASLERLSMGTKKSTDLMREPSLSHQALSENPTWKASSRPNSDPEKAQETLPREACDRCKKVLLPVCHYYPNICWFCGNTKC